MPLRRTPGDEVGAAGAAGGRGASDSLRTDRRALAFPRAVLAAVAAALLASGVAFAGFVLPAYRRADDARRSFRRSGGISVAGGSGAAEGAEGRPATGDELLHECAGRIPFPADRAVPCEGYWRRAQPAPDGQGPGEGRLRWPAAWPGRPWCGQRLWLRRLEYIELRAREDDTRAHSGAGGAQAVPGPMLAAGGEAVADDGRPAGARAPAGVRVVRQRGLASSRIDDSLLGNVEFVDTDPVFAIRDGPVAARRQAHLDRVGHVLPGDGDGAAGVPMCWTGDMGEHYVGGHNVVPSREFYDYVVAKYAAITRYLD